MRSAVVAAVAIAVALALLALTVWMDWHYLTP